MRSVVLMIGLLAAYAGAEDVKFTYTPPQDGDVCTRTMVNSMSLKLTIKGGEKPYTREDSLDDTTKFTQTVLKAGKNGPVKVKVDYHTDNHSASSPDGVEKSTQPVEGKSYIVTARTTAEPKVDYAEGKYLVPLAEKDMIVEDFDGLGNIPRFSRLFHGKTFTSGEKVPIEDKFAQGLFTDTGTVSNLVIKLKDVRKAGGFDVAVFDTEALFTRREGPLTYEVPLKGELSVGVHNAWLVKIAISGPLSVTGEKVEEAKPKMTAEGTGKMKFSISNDYGK